MNRRRLEARVWTAVIGSAGMLVSCHSSVEKTPPVGEGIVATGVTLELPSSPSPIRVAATRLTLDPVDGSTMLQGDVVVTIDGPSALRVTAEKLRVDRDGEQLHFQGGVHASIALENPP